MSASEIERTLVRLAHEIVEKSNGSDDLALVGSSAEAFRLPSGWANSSPVSKNGPSIPVCSTSSFIATTYQLLVRARW